MAKYFYFARHGQTVWNVENKICGATDIALTAKGHEQAKELGEIIKKSEQFGKYVSFFPFGGNVTDLTLEGFKYSLDHYRLTTADSGLTVSNEIVSEKAKVTYQSGTLLMIMSRD